MSLGFDRELDVINLGDTAPVYASLRDKDDNAVPADEILGVIFTIQAPDDSKTTVTGEVLDNGQGYLLYPDTDAIGEYTVVSTFSLVNGEKRSARSDFEVIDPFNPPVPTASEIIAQLTWDKLEDCFDAEDEGPWLRDQTLNAFNEQKMQDFINDALFDINAQNPPTNLAIGTFVLNGVATADAPLVAQAVFVQVLHHLLRSYAEQPQMQGGQVVYEDRRDYLQRWQTVLETEYQKYMRWLALYKRRFLGLGESRLLVSSKAGRLLPAPLRTRNVGRGVY